MSFQGTSRSVLLLSVFLLLASTPGYLPNNSDVSCTKIESRRMKKKYVNREFYNYSDQKDCQLTRRSGILKDLRIVGGGRVHIQRFPFMAAVLKDNKFICGGSLITLFHVLTAGHCVVKLLDSMLLAMVPTRLKVRVGSNYKHLGGMVYSVAWVFIHPWYTKYEYDCAVLEVEREFELSLYVGLVQFATRNDTERLIRLVQSRAECITLGWGSTEPRMMMTRSSGSDNNFVQFLRGLRVRLLPWKECFEQAFIDKEKELCTNIDGIGGDCQGDSGGPLLCANKLYGIVSWGVGCGRPEEPDIFSRVDTMSDFISKALSEKGMHKKLRRKFSSYGAEWRPGIWCYFLAVVLHFL